jgi:methionyl-tRNA formyltransferase
VNVIIVTQDDPFYLPIFFETFLDGLNKEMSGVNILGVVIQRPLGQRSKKALLRRMVDFYGPVVFTMVSLKYILRKISNRLNQQGILKRAYSTEYFCGAHGVRILPHRNVNHPRFVQFVKESKIDLIVSVAAAQIFKPEILKAPKLGCINIHNAPLPDYRGMMPSFWQLYHGERQTVATIHEMVQEIDKGRIIYQEQTTIDRGMTLDALIKKTRRVDALALLKVLQMFKQGRVKYHALSQKKGSYFSFPSKRDVVEFKRRGYRVV